MAFAIRLQLEQYVFMIVLRNIPVRATYLYYTILPFQNTRQWETLSIFG